MRLNAAVALACALFLGTGVQAQETTASIVGVVHDVSGGVIPGATVTAVEEGGLAVHAVTDGSGWYRFPALPPGVFAVTAHLTGFVPARVESVELRLGQVDRSLNSGTSPWCGSRAPPRAPIAGLWGGGILPPRSVVDALRSRASGDVGHGRLRVWGRAGNSVSPSDVIEDALDE